MGRLIAIGDIHGRFSRLEGLVARINPAPDDRLVFLGDYVDNGPDSFEVVEFLIALKEKFPNTITLRGNHEDYIISLFMGNQNRFLHDNWLRDGGRQTLTSYKRRDCYLKEHREFYESLPLYWETEEYFFCHAGVRPGVSLDRQRPTDLLQIREPFLSSTADFGKVVVHGHTIVDEPAILPNRINIDTGAREYGPLTAVELPSLAIWRQL